MGEPLKKPKRRGNPQTKRLPKIRVQVASDASEKLSSTITQMLTKNGLIFMEGQPVRHYGPTDFPSEVSNQLVHSIRTAPNSSVCRPGTLPRPGIGYCGVRTALKLRQRRSQSRFLLADGCSAHGGIHFSCGASGQLPFLGFALSNWPLLASNASGHGTSHRDHAPAWP